MAVKAAKLAQPTIPKHPEPIYDAVFFPMQAIKVGTVLLNFGMRDPGSEWVVAGIEKFVRTPTGFTLVKSDEVTRLSDLVQLRRRPPVVAMMPSLRRPNFGSLKYSAIWRLKQ